MCEETNQIALLKKWEHAASERDHFQSQIVRKDDRVDHQASESYGYWKANVQGIELAWKTLHPEMPSLETIAKEPHHYFGAGRR